MNLDLPLEDLELSVRHFLTLRDTGMLLVSDLASFSAQEIRERISDDPDLLYNARRALAGMGVHLKGESGVVLGPGQPVPDETWGALHVFDDGPGAFARVLERVVRAYLAEGYELAEDGEDVAIPTDEAELNTADMLGPDAVLVIEEEAEGWFAVLSAEFEWCRPAEHPLAQALSWETDVVSITAAADRYSEITLYSGGEIKGIRLIGESLPLVARLRQTPPPLDLTWFEGRGALEPAVGLFDLLGDPDAFGSIAGCEEQGFRATAREYGEEALRERLLVFR